MLRPFVKINIQQVPTELYPNRDELLELDFVSYYDIVRGWENHTDNCLIKFPKNVILETDNYLFRQSGTYNVILGGSGNNGNFDTNGNPIKVSPLIMRGDIVYIQDGYWYKNEVRKDIQIGSTVYQGFVSSVKSEIPIEISVEDNFYLLKRTPVNKSVFSGNLVDLCKYIVEQVNANFGNNNKLNGRFGNPYPVLSFFKNPDSITADFSLGHLDIGDITCAELLNRLRSRYKIESFFVENELHFGFPIYDEEKANSDHFFEFENNIFPDHDLEYKNKDDLVLSAVVSCQEIKKTGKKTRDGLEATKKDKLSILIYWDIVSSSFKYYKKEKGESFPENSGGERHEFVYPIDPLTGNPTVEKLFDFGKKQLQKYYYTGFRGSFKTIGFPVVNWGDNINLESKVFSDRNGQYKVKKVKRTGGQGIEQEIFLDYKLNVDLPSSTETIYML